MVVKVLVILDRIPHYRPLVRTLIDIFGYLDINVVGDPERVRVHAAELFLQLIHKMLLDLVHISWVDEEMVLFFYFLEIGDRFQL